MYVCMYVCICMYCIYIHIYTIHIYTYIHTYMHMYDFVNYGRIRSQNRSRRPTLIYLIAGRTVEHVKVCIVCDEHMGRLKLQPSISGWVG
jgi:hypothetical protein